MYFKLSAKNVRKSFKDYALYFLTLTFGVCIFYIFNSIEAQQAMMVISESTAEMMKVLTEIMGAISIFVSFILGFLIVYANNFLIRRRKKEIGIYMTLGMEKGKVAKLLVAETFIIGILSLGVGLLAGVFLSQGLSVVTAKLYEADMTSFKFIFSSTAFVKTIIYFGIIFIVVMIAGTISISKYKLIDLINAEKQNEKQRLKNPILTIVLFILSIGFLGTAYGLVLKNGIVMFDNRLLVEIILGTIGTFLFFASLSGFFLRVLQGNKKRYLKGLNMFVLRQINSRINSAQISMSFICLMLFCTIGILSTGMGMNNVLNKNYKDSAPFDASVKLDGNLSIVDKLKQYGFDVYNYADKAVEFSLYEYTKENTAKESLFSKIKTCNAEAGERLRADTPLYIIKLTDYNKLLKLQGKKELVLQENQTAVYSDYIEIAQPMKDALSKLVKDNNTVKIENRTYSIYPKALQDGIATSLSSNIFVALVVPDGVEAGNEVRQTILSFNCKGDSKAMMKKFEGDLERFSKEHAEIKEEIKMTGATKETIRSVSAGTQAIVSFVGIYLGIIFLITSAAILALQQLSETTDNRHRYEILQKIGADEKLINSTLFKQIAIYFLMPLALACIHSVVGIKVANAAINDVGNINALSNIVITALLIIIVYGSYFLATYFSSKRIILKGSRA